MTPRREPDGGSSLEDLKLQEIDRHQSRALQMLSNVTKKISDTAGSIMSNFGDAGGASPGGAKKKTGLSLLLGLLFLGVAVFVGVLFLAPWLTPPGTTYPNPGPPGVEAPNPGPADPPVQYPPNPCALQFENPTGPEGIPLSGPLDVQWSSLRGAASYEFRVIPPEGAGNPWLIATDGTSKKIYMENFPAAGQHTFSLTALDRNGSALCSIELTFDKPAFGGEAGQARDASEGGECYSLLACP